MPKNPSPAQVAASQKNGAKGRGALSPETKQRSSQNARKWGLFAKTVALPHELPAWAERSHVWHTYYGPRSPATMHLTNECARATLIADRCENYRQSTIEQQTRDEHHKWKTGQQRKADRLAKQLRGQPQATVQKLQSFGEGTRLMISGFEELIEDIQSQGHLPQDDLELAVCLFGVAPTQEQIRQDAMAYLVYLHNLGCTPGVSSQVVAEWLKPENRPDVLQNMPVDEVFGADADDNRDLLLEVLNTEVERLRALADRLAREVDEPSLVAVLERASILTEEAARRVTRSHAEARTTYHRASTALWPLLDREKEEGSPESVGDDANDNDNEATEPAFEPVSAVPVSAPRDEVGGTQIEPEDPSGALAQTADESEGSVAGRPSGPERQIGVLSPAPALENTPSEAWAEGDGSEGESDDPSRVAQRAPESVAAVPELACREGAGDAPSVEGSTQAEWDKWVPLSACRRPEWGPPGDPDEAAAQLKRFLKEAVASIKLPPSAMGGPEGDPDGAPGVPETPSWGVAGLDPSHPTLL